MRVLFANRSEADLAKIEDHIAADNPTRALTFVRELRASCLVLAQGPRAYPVIGVYRRRELRRKVHRNYLILYQLRESDVVIVRILHGARDYHRLLAIPRDQSR